MVKSSSASTLLAVPVPPRTAATTRTRTAIPSLPVRNSNRTTPISMIAKKSHSNSSNSNGNGNGNGIHIRNRNRNSSTKKSKQDKNKNNNGNGAATATASATATATATKLDMDTDMNILDIPDPPTPDERSLAKTAAAARAMRKRRKSRRLSGSLHVQGQSVFSASRSSVNGNGGGTAVSIGAVTGTGDGSGNDADADANAAENAYAFTSSANTGTGTPTRSRTVTMEAQLRDVGLLSTLTTSTSTIATSTLTSITCQEFNKKDTSTTCNMDDSNMDWAEGDSMDLGEDHHNHHHDKLERRQQQHQHNIINDHEDPVEVEVEAKLELGATAVVSEEVVIRGTPQETHTHTRTGIHTHKHADDDTDTGINKSNMETTAQSICFDDSDEDNDGDNDGVFLTPLKRKGKGNGDGDSNSNSNDNDKTGADGKGESESTSNGNGDGDAIGNSKREKSENIHDRDRTLFSSGKKRRRSGSILIPNQEEVRKMNIALGISDVNGSAGVGVGVPNASNTAEHEHNHYSNRGLDDMASPMKRARTGNANADMHAHNRKREGRQSIMLPSELGPGLGPGSPSGFGINFIGKKVQDRDQHQHRNQVVKKSTKNNNAPSPSCRSSRKANACTNLLDDFDKMNDIKAAIRRYCSVPLEERYRSDEAIKVEELTGYPLISSMDKINREKMENGSISSPIRLNWASSQSSKMSPKSLAQLSNDMKRNLFEKIRPLVQIMEKKKQQDIAMLEDATKCRVERKRGKFRYCCLKTGKKVSSKEYERRYLHKIRQQRHARVLEMIAQKEQKIKVSCEDDSHPPTITSDSDGDENKPVTHDMHHNSPNHVCGGDLLSVEVIDSHDISPNEEDLDFDLDNRAFDIPSEEEIRADPELAEAQRKMQEAIDKAVKEYAITVQCIRSERRLLQISKK